MKEDLSLNQFSCRGGGVLCVLGRDSLAEPIPLRPSLNSVFLLLDWLPYQG